MFNFTTEHFSLIFDGWVYNEKRRTFILLSVWEGLAMIDFRYVVRESEIDDVVNGRLVQKRVVLIGVRNEQSGVIFPHPISDFIRTKYEFKGVGLSSQLNAARAIVGFFNFIQERIQESDPEFVMLKQTGIKGIQLLHASRYISHLTDRGLKRDTVLTTQGYLTRFFDYLQHQRLLLEPVEVKEVMNKNGQVSMLPIFDHPSLETRYPSTNGSLNDKLKDFGDNRKRLVTEFIQESREVSPRISFAICLQFFGGLRLGEVVNLMKSSLHVQGVNNFQSLVVDVQDNQKKLFSHLRSNKKEQVKRPRKQSVLTNHLLREIYEDHINWLNGQRNVHPFALFLNTDGKPLSGSAYESQFKKVKNSYLDKLRTTTGRYHDYLLLKKQRWSTHIGRGIFTNFLLDMGMTVTQIALARGDKNIQSALSYVDQKFAQETIRQFVNEFQTLADIQKGHISSNKLDQWRGKNE